MERLLGPASREAVLPVLLAGFAFLLLYYSKDNNPTAALFPRVVGTVTLAAIGLDFFLHWAKAKQAREKAEEKDTGMLGWTAPLALQAGYIALIYVIGFSTATLVFLLLCPWQLRYRRWVVISAHAIVFTMILVMSFQSLFHIRLPKGLIALPW